MSEYNATSKRFAVGLAFFTIMGDFGNASAASIRLLGFQGGRTARVESISHDGTVAVGSWRAANGNYVAVRWDHDSRTDCPFGESNSMYAYAVSADGRYMTGFSGLPTNGNAFRVDASWNLQDLGRPTTAFGPATGTELSADGSVVVGYFRSTTTLNRRAFRWSASEGIVNIGHIFGNTSGNTEPTGVSSDGRIIVGQSKPGSYVNPGYAFYWTQTAGIQALPMPGGASNLDSAASAISGDGRVIIGGGVYLTAAVVWRDLVPQYLPSPQGWVVRGGQALDFTGEHALVNLTRPGSNDIVDGIYSPSTGTMPAVDYFRHFGLDIPETAQLDIRCISGDGRSFGGSYSDPVMGVAYQGVVITVPGPSSALLFVATTLFASRRRRRVSASRAEQTGAR